MLAVHTSGYPVSPPPPSNQNSGGFISGDLGQQVVSQGVSVQSPTNSTAGSKRKQDSAGTGSQALDHAARLAQEEDKRRRNTAASARFRVKKKEREKNLERTVKDVTAKNSTLEARVNQLEMENRWLKNLITEKNGSRIADGDITGMFKRFQEGKEGLNQGLVGDSHGPDAS